MSTEEFLDLTPAQFDLLMREHHRRIERDEFMLGQLTAATINYGACRPKEPVAAKDFMPSQWGKVEGAKQEKKPRRNRRRTAMEVRSVFEVLARIQNGGQSGSDPDPGA